MPLTGDDLCIQERLTGVRQLLDHASEGMHHHRLLNRLILPLDQWASST
jgi:hypothetical protein